MYNVRCFRTKGRDEAHGDGRYGIWIMTRPGDPDSTRGIFFHGRRKEHQAPRYSINELDDGEWSGVAITHDEALAFLSEWPEAQRELLEIFDRHRIESKV